MSIEYSVNRTSVPKKTMFFDIRYLNSKESPLLGQILNPYALFFNFNETSLYPDLENAKRKMEAFHTLLEDTTIKNVLIMLPTILLQNQHKDRLEFILSGMIHSIFKNIYKTKIKIIVTHPGKENPFLKSLISKIRYVQNARKLSMLPANIATPEYISKAILKQFRKMKSIKTHIYKKSYLEKHKLNLLLAVNQGSQKTPCLLTIERITNPNKPTVCIIGKGITFDSGGLAIKRLSSMKDMKYDKIGAISGAMALAYLLELPELNHINLVGVFPFAENVISENAIRPGDVIQSYSKKTVEIVNPDAEGRLILADAFAYASKYKPTVLIDIATLTGHAEYINCWHNGYYFAMPDSLRTQVEKRSYQIGERMIPMPPWTEFKNIFYSPVADLLNDSSICDDSFTAALFLKEFLPKSCDWLHIDLAHEHDNHIPNGNGIRTIIDTVVQMYGKKK